MIIRLTVKDNDFTHILKNYLKNIYNNILYDANDDIMEYLHHDRVIRKILNPNYSEDWTEEQKDILIERIKESFKAYCNNDDYLISNLEVTISKEFTDNWENDEVVYWLQHSNNVITQ